MDRKGINISMNHVKWVLRSQHWGGQGKRYWFRIPPPGAGVDGQVVGMTWKGRGAAHGVGAPNRSWGFIHGGLGSPWRV